MPEAMKLCIIVVPARDGDQLLRALATHAFGATRIGSAGGFLKRGSATVFSAVEAGQVTELLNLLHRDFPEVTQMTPVSSLPFFDELETLAPATVEVRVGGAVLFVLPLERFERV